MVASCVTLVYGREVSIDKLKEYAEYFKNTIYFEDGECPEIIDSHVIKSLDLYKLFPHAEEEKYIIGAEIKTYYRLKSKCKKCPDKYFNCDDCINLTENGQYDIVNAQNKFVTLDINDFCSNCQHHNNFGSKIGDDCSKCHFPFKKLDPCALEYGFRLMKEAGIKLGKPEYKIFVVPDDCLCCT